MNILERINNWIDDKDDPPQERNSNASNAFEGNVSDADLAGGNHGEAGSATRMRNMLRGQIFSGFLAPLERENLQFRLALSGVWRVPNDAPNSLLTGSPKDSGILARSGVPLRPNSLIHILATRSHFTTS